MQAFICSAKSHRYNVNREMIGATFLKALIIEEKMRNNHFAERTVNQYRRNPAVFARDYNILLQDIFNYPGKKDGLIQMMHRNWNK